LTRSAYLMLHVKGPDSASINELCTMRKTKFSIAIILSSLLLLSVSAMPAANAATIWNDINPTVYINPPANPSLNSLYMLSATEGWAVGDSRPTTNITTGLPAIVHYDGFSWNLVPAPKFPDFPSNQAAYNLTSVTFGPPGNPISGNDGWTVGFNSTITGTGPPFPCGGGVSPTCSSVALHWDGVSWRVMTPGLTGLNAGPLWSAFMVSSTDVWAVGQNVAGTAGVFWHWSGIPGLGGGWNMPQSVPNIFFYSVFMVSATEGWAVGSGGAIWHYFGGQWEAISSPVTASLRSIFMTSATDGWAVGDGGTIVHYTGGIWTGPVSPGTTTNNLLSVFMVSSTEGWAGGAAGTTGTILHYSGGTWTALPTNQIPTAPVSKFNFNSVFATSATDIWAVGSAGVILHWDGVNWGTVTSPTIDNFTSISFGPPLAGPINPNDGWAVGNASEVGEPTIYHWNGFMWTKGVAIGTSNNLNSVFMLSGGDVWTVGGGFHTTASCSAVPCPVILHFAGGSWNTVTPPPGSYILKSVFMVSSSEGWAVGEQVGSPHPTGILLHYTVTGGVGTWAIFPAPSSPSPTPPLNSIFMLGPNEGWAVGDNSTILHYTVTGGVGTWNTVSVSGTPFLSQYANLTSVFMLSPTSGWIVGGIQFGSLDSFGAFSAGPVILNWDGTKWAPVATPTIPGGTSPYGRTSALLKSVYCTGPDDCWTGGWPGKLVATLFHWDGIAWNQVTTSPALLGQNLPSGSGGVVYPPIVSSIYLTSPGYGWIVGSSRSYTSSTPVYGDPLHPFPTELSAILRMSPPLVLGVTTSVTTIVSTVSMSTTFLTGSTVSTSTIVTSITSTNTTIVTPPSSSGAILPIIIGIVAALAVAVVLILLLVGRRRPQARPVVMYPIQRRHA